MTALVVGLAFVVAVLTVLVVGLLRSHADILRALHELGGGIDPARERAAGAGPVAVAPPAPRAAAAGGEPITGTTPDGGTVAVALSPRPHPTLLAFLTSGCTTCAGFWSAFQQEVELPGPGTRLVVVTMGPEQESPAAVQRLAPRGITTVQSSEAWRRFGVPGSPYFVLVDGSTGAVVGEGSATTWDHVRDLLARSVADGAVPAARGTARQGITAAAAQREADVDAALARAGIEPGHPSLYPTDAPRPDDP